MSVDFPILLALSPVLALLVAWLAWRARRARLHATALWAPAGLAAEPSSAGPWLLTASSILVTIGAAGPRWGRSEADVEGRSLNLAIALDISRSMLAEDVAPNRLIRAVREARRLVQDARGDRIALLAFAGRSYILTPLTLDDGAVSLQLDALDPEVASEGGSDLAAVLNQGRDLLTAASEGGARVLVVFTDGETHGPADGAVAAAAALRSAGITLVMVGAGDSLPARIPVRDERGAMLGYKTDAEGRVVRTTRNDEVLRSVTDAAGGTLVPAASADQGGAVSRVLAGLQRTAARERRREDLTPRGWLFALTAVLLLSGHALRRPRPALAALALTLLGAGAATAQRPSPGDRLLRQGDTAGAAAAFASDAPRRTSSDSALFNAGTAALARAQFAAARQWLTQASHSLDPGLRYRALYNLGLVALLEARADTSKHVELEDEATQRFREALLLLPGSHEAKWNLELVQQRTPPPSGGGGGAPPSSPPRRAPPTPTPTGSGALSQAEAEQILNSVERTERDVRADQVRRRRLAQSAVGKDW